MRIGDEKSLCLCGHALAKRAWNALPGYTLVWQHGAGLRGA